MMVPRKRPYQSHRQNSRKRSFDHFERSGFIETKRICITRTDQERREIDKYCWICHTLGQDTNCNFCVRAFHFDCLTRSSGKFNVLKACPECQLQSLDGTDRPKFGSSEKFQKLLQMVTIRAYGKKRAGKGILLRWPENLGINKLVKIIDFGILLDYINRGRHYKKTADIYSDIKFMYHNCCIMYGAKSEQAKSAEQMRKHFRKELLDLESCPECYYHLYCDESELDPFVRLCDPPHDIVWAQLTGHPFWPAKCLKVVKGIAHVRFFGEHEISDLPLSKIFRISESHPKFKNSKITSATNSGPKSLRYKSAIMELVKYIQLYTRVYGEFPYFPHRTHYKPEISQNELNSDEAELAPNVESEENQLLYEATKGIQLKLEGNTQDEDLSTGEFTETCQGMDEENCVTSRTNNDNPLNNSAVTRVDMTFSTEPSHPIVTSISSLSTDRLSTSTTGQISGENILNFDNILRTSDLKSRRETATGTIAPVGAVASLNSDGEILFGNPVSLLNQSIRLVHDSRATSSEISIAEMNGEPISPGPDEIQNENSNASTEIISNPSESMEEEVVILEDNTTANDTYIPRGDQFNPAYVLPFILEAEPQLKSLFQHGQFILTAFFVRLWAMLQKCPSAPERISTAVANWKKYEALYHKSEREKEQLKLELANVNEANEKYKKEIKRLTGELKTMNWKIKQEKEKTDTTVDNATIVTEALKNQVTSEDSRWSRKYDALLVQTEEIIKERDFYKAELEKSKELNDEEKLHHLRVHDYCTVCEEPANIHCCLNYNYCGSSCRVQDFPEHVNVCTNPSSRPPKPDMTPTDQSSIHRNNLRIHRHSKTIANIHIEVQRKSSEIITSETREVIDTPPASVETDMVSSPATYHTETEDPQIESSPASSTAESSDQSIGSPTFYHDGKRYGKILYE